MACVLLFVRHFQYLQFSKLYASHVWLIVRDIRTENCLSLCALEFHRTFWIIYLLFCFVILVSAFIGITGLLHFDLHFMAELAIVISLFRLVNVTWSWCEFGIFLFGALYEVIGIRVMLNFWQFTITQSLSVTLFMKKYSVFVSSEYLQLQSCLSHNSVV